MAGSTYYRKQATLLRKLAGLSLNATLSDRLLSMAADFDSKAKSGSAGSADAMGRNSRGDGDEGHG